MAWYPQKRTQVILNPNLYKDALDKQKETILRGILEGVKYDILTILSLGSHIPIAAVIAYAMRPEMGGPNPHLQRVLDLAIDCYKYTGITPWSDLP